MDSTGEVNVIGFVVWRTARTGRVIYQSTFAPTCCYALAEVDESATRLRLYRRLGILAGFLLPGSRVAGGSGRSGFEEFL